jgi:hypothetical protein
MAGDIPLQEMRKKVADLQAIAQDLYDHSDDFPGVNRNVKRILASIEMVKINLEEPS